jgi:hypothetical protein
MEIDNSEYLKGTVLYVNKKIIPCQNRGNGIILGNDGNNYEIRLSIFDEKQKAILEKLENGADVFFKTDGDPDEPTAMLDEFFMKKNDVKTDFYETLLLMATAKYSRVFDYEQDQERFKYFCDLAVSIQEDLILEMERIAGKNIWAFNVMAPSGGPMHIRKGASCHINPFTSTSFECIHDCWVGHISLWHDKCGIDNLKVLLEFNC